MLAAKLIDNIWATRKVDSLNGLKLMLAQVIGGIDDGKRLVVIDIIGAGIGDRVIICTGSSSRNMLGRDDIPIDAAVVGIIDQDCNFD